MPSEEVSQEKEESENKRQKVKEEQAVDQSWYQRFLPAQIESEIIQEEEIEESP